MPKVSCAVVKCSNSSNKIFELKKQDCLIHKGKKRGCCECKLPFQHFKFPEDSDVRDRWITLINRKNKDESKWIPNASSAVCSDHFIDGKPTEANPLPTLKLSYKPTSNKVCNRKPPKERQAPVPNTLPASSTTLAEYNEEVDNMTHVTNAEDIPEPAAPYESGSGSSITVKREVEVVSTKTRFNPINSYWNYKRIQSLEGKIRTQLMQIASLKKTVNKKQYLYKKLLTSDEKCKFYTNVPKLEQFFALCHYFTLHERAEQRKKNKIVWPTISTKVSMQFKSKSRSTAPMASLQVQDRLLLVLMKLRLGLMHRDLADRFGISLSDVSIIFRETLRGLAAALQPMIVFYTRQEVAKTIPQEYREYPRLRCIIDCSEIFIQRSTSLDVQVATWSDYKHHNTLKFLIGCTPQGSICYISEMWGGRASDKHIVRKSSFLDFIHPNDEVLADRGFQIADELRARRASLVLPPAGGGRAQHTAQETAKTKKVANVRIHIERVIRNLKVNKVLSTVMPISLVPVANEILFVCAGIVNLGGPIVKHWRKDDSE